MDVRVYDGPPFPRMGASSNRPTLGPLRRWEPIDGSRGELFGYLDPNRFRRYRRRAEGVRSYDPYEGLRRAGVGAAMMHWANRPGGAIARVAARRTLGREWDPNEDPSTRKRKPDPKADPKPPGHKRRKGEQARARPTGRKDKPRAKRARKSTRKGRRGR